MKTKKKKTEEKSEEITFQLYDADPKCKHKFDERWSGCKCVKCGGWFCY